MSVYIVSCSSVVLCGQLSSASVCIGDALVYSYWERELDYGKGDNCLAAKYDRNERSYRMTVRPCNSRYHYLCQYGTSRLPVITLTTTVYGGSLTYHVKVFSYLVSYSLLWSPTGRAGFMPQ